MSRLLKSILVLFLLSPSVYADTFGGSFQDFGPRSAYEVLTVPNGFTGILGASDTNVQQALETLSLNAGSGSSSIIYDISDDTVNESSALGEIAVTGDTNSIFTEPTADKALINVSLKWPTSDQTDDLSTTGYNNLEAHDMEWTGAHEFQGSVEMTGGSGAALIFGERSTDPVTLTNEGALYSKDLNGDTRPWWRLQSSGSVKKIFISGDTISSIYDLNINTSGQITADSVVVTTEVYDSTGWNSDNTVPTKDATRDKIETMPQTAGDGLTLTGTDIDFDGGDTPGGELGNTWASPTLDDGVTVANWLIGTSSLQTTFVFEASIGTDYITADSTNMRMQNSIGLIIPNAASPVVNTFGSLAVDSTDRGQLLAVSGDSASLIVVPGTLTQCVSIENLATTDDNSNINSFPWPVTIKQIWCECEGTCTTTTGLTFEDDAANSMTITSTPSCATGSSIPVPVLVTAGGSLAARESWQFDVGTISPDGSDEYTLCWEYSVNRQ